MTTFECKNLEVIHSFLRNVTGRPLTESPFFDDKSLEDFQGAKTALTLFSKELKLGEIESKSIAYRDNATRFQAAIDDGKRPTEEMQVADSSLLKRLDDLEQIVSRRLHGTP